MPTLYVAGPVLRRMSREEREFSLYSIYQGIVAVCREQGWDCQIPELEEELDKLSPREFVSEITRRLSKASAAVIVLTSGDQSVPVEATLTVSMGIPQTIALYRMREAPRMLVGLPNVTAVVNIDSSEDLLAVIRQMIRFHSFSV